MPEALKKRMIKTLVKVFAEKAKPIYQCDKLGNVITRWKSQGELERLTTFKRKHVGRVLNGQFKTHKGFVWRYENE